MLRKCLYLLVFIVGCFASAPASDPSNTTCARTPDCPAGRICIDDACVQPCETSQTCAEEQACIDGVCKIYDAGCQGFDDCVDGFWCNIETNQCVRAIPTGTACNDDAACQTGYCVDGLCCQSPCTGVCEECSSQPGLCKAVDLGQDPEDECSGEAACDGARTCFAKTVSSSCNEDYECASGACVDGVCCESTCEGACKTCATGQCLDVVAAEDANSCSATLANDSCVSPPCMCNTAGACVSSAVTTCTNDDQCPSGSCQGGVCCLTPCSGNCFSCSATQTGAAQSGECLPITAGADPLSACPGATACDGEGACFAKPNGTPVASAAECASGIRADGVCCSTTCSSTCYRCDGVDTSSPAGTCGLINPGKDPNNECSGVVACDGAGACYARPPLADCSQDYQCDSGVCCGGKCRYGWAPMASGTTKDLNGVGLALGGVYAVGDTSTIKNLLADPTATWTSDSGVPVGVDLADIGGTSNLRTLASNNGIVYFRSNSAPAWDSVVTDAQQVRRAVFAGAFFLVAGSNLANTGEIARVTRNDAGSLSIARVLTGGSPIVSLSGGVTPMAVGQLWSGTVCTGRLLSTSGAMWTFADVALPSTVSCPGAAISLPDNKLLVATHRNNATGCSLQGDAHLRSSSGTWTHYTDSGPITALDTVDGKVFAVGGCSASSFDGSKWTTKPMASPKKLNDVVAVSACEAYAVGDGGVILKY